MLKGYFSTSVQLILRKDNKAKKQVSLEFKVWHTTLQMKLSLDTTIKTN